MDSATKPDDIVTKEEKSPTVHLKMAKIFTTLYQKGTQIIITGIAGSILKEILVLEDNEDEAKLCLTLKGDKKPHLRNKPAETTSEELLQIEPDENVLLDEDVDGITMQNTDITQDTINIKVEQIVDDTSDVDIDDVEEALSDMDDILSDAKDTEVLLEIKKGAGEEFCDVCNVTLEDKQEALQHRLTHAETSRRSTTRRHTPLRRKGTKWNCQEDGCAAEFNAKVGFNRHMREVHQSAIHRCSGCDQRFHRRPELLRHIRDKHPDLEMTRCPFVCPDCGAGFEVKQRLDKHYKEQHERLVDKTTCTVCRKELRKENLKMHMTRHTGVGLYRCEICDAAFSWRGSVRSHQRKAHGMFGGVDSHVCTLCDRNFKEKGTLKQHMMIHSGQKSFCCDVCGAKFARRGDLKKHDSIIHQGIRKYVCNVCGKGFSATETLVAHMNAHTGFKPFACDQCDNAFSSKGHLKRHVKNVHDAAVQGHVPTVQQISVEDASNLEEITIPVVEVQEEQSQTDQGVQYALIYIDSPLAKNDEEFSVT